MEAEGCEAIFARHAACGAAARAGLQALGFDLFADPAYASDSVTSAHLPEGVEWSALNRELRARGLVLAGGQGKLKGKIFRIGHLGHVSVEDIVRAIEVLEEGATAVGLTVPRGVAAEAAREAGAAAAAGAPAPRPRGLTMRVLVAEKLAPEGVELLRAAARRRRPRRASRARSSWRPCPTTTRCSCAAASRPMPRPSPPVGAWSSSAGPASAWTTSTSRPPPRPASSSSTRRPATPWRPPSTPWPCSSPWPATSRLPTPRCMPASGTASAFMGRELVDKTLGVIGLGKIGMAVADRARALGMEVVGHDPFVTAEAAALHGITPVPLAGDPARSPMP